jgi:hypothetical protein
VVGEVAVSKDAGERVERVQGAERRTEVKVEEEPDVKPGTPLRM